MGDVHCKGNVCAELTKNQEEGSLCPPMSPPGNAKLSRGYALMLSNILDRIYNGVVGLEVLYDELVSYQRPLSY